MRNRLWVFPSLVAAAVVLAACGSTNPPDPASNNAAPAAAQTHTVTIKKMHTSKGVILTTASGHALYWFGKDTKTRSKCNGSCATFWPPVIGKAVAAAGISLPHGFGTIKRADGQIQATYDGHPLYTYAADTKAGQVRGNGIDASGGWWWAVTPTGKKLGSHKSHKSHKKHKSSGSSSGGSGGGSGW
jgi:predicted lipoprotein with Yx(FWY)xxD motif